MSEEKEIINSIFKSMRDLFSTGVNYAASGFENADDEVYQQRIDTCNKCEHLTKTNQCGLCLCFIHLKAKIAIAECPAGKWTKNNAGENIRVAGGKCCDKKTGA